MAAKNYTFLQKRSFSKISRQGAAYTNARKVRVSQKHSLIKVQFFAQFSRSTLLKICMYA
jgi:hypothetical protein